jgi:hypothetical protein
MRDPRFYSIKRHRRLDCRQQDSFHRYHQMPSGLLLGAENGLFRY